MRALAATAVIAALLLPASLSAAQDAAARAAARELFEEGVTHVDNERWPEAVDRFERALELYDSAVIRFNLARVYSETNRVVEASEQLRNVIRREDAGEEVQAAAAELLAELESRIAHLTIRLEGDADEIQHDGEVVPSAMLGIAVPADPGTHELVATLNGTVVARETVELSDAQRAVVVLRAPASQGQAVIVPDPEDPVVPGDEPEIYEQWWFWGIIGVVVVGTVLGITLGVALSGDSCEGDFMPCRIDLP